MKPTKSFPPLESEHLIVKGTLDRTLITLELASAETAKLGFAVHKASKLA